MLETVGKKKKNPVTEQRSYGVIAIAGTFFCFFGRRSLIVMGKKKFSDFRENTEPCIKWSKVTCKFYA